MKLNTPPLLSKWLHRAAGMTRQGRLAEATEVIQRALRQSGLMPPSGPATPAPPAAAPRWSADVVDAVVREAPAPAPQGAGERAAAPSAPTSGRFLAGSYSSPAGARDYKLFVPASPASAPLPLVVMLHGCTQDPDDFARGTRMNELAQEHGFLVLYPAQAPRSNSSKCWNWFQPGDQQRGRGEPALLAGMTRHVMTEHPVDPHRVYVAGLSAGGAMAAILAREYADLYAAAGVHSGLPQGAAHDVMTAFQAMKGGPSPARAAHGGTRPMAPTIVFHGDRDTTVSPLNGQHVIGDAMKARPEAVEPQVSVGQSANGRRYTHTRYCDAHGRVLAEHWEVHGAGHAWSGGSAQGSYADAQGPDASREMLRFFLANPLQRVA
jgi:poly(hydroxyalkanoate) depolymerase family esterase